MLPPTKPCCVDAPIRTSLFDDATSTALPRRDNARKPCDDRPRTVPPAVTSEATADPLRLSSSRSCDAEASPTVIEPPALMRSVPALALADTTLIPPSENTSSPVAASSAPEMTPDLPFRRIVRPDWTAPTSMVPVDDCTSTPSDPDRSPDLMSPLEVILRTPADA